METAIVVEPAVPSEFVVRNNASSRQKMLRLLFERDGRNCRYCDCVLTLKNGTIEHLTPQSRGGSNRITNLAVSCERCNSDKSSMTDEEYKAYLRGEYGKHCKFCGKGLRTLDYDFCSGHEKRARWIARREPMFYAMLMSIEDPSMRRMILNDMPRGRVPITDYI